MSQPPSKGWHLWQSWEMPKFVAAPMVNQSELSFRLAVRKYGVQVTYSPMVNAGMVVRGGKKYLEAVLTTDDAVDTPLVIQLAGSNLPEMQQAVRTIKARHSPSAFDINFGCPQGIANSGLYGAYLLNQPALVESVTKAVVEAADETPVFVKMRKVAAGPTGVNLTLDLCRRCITAGAVVICLHGRTKEEKGQHTGPADWDIIRQAVQSFPETPIVANGGLATYEDALRCLEYTGAAAVMSGEALLENFAFFSGPEITDVDVVVAEYLRIAVQRHEAVKAVKAHLFHSLYRGLQVHTDLRDQLCKAKTLEELCVLAEEMKRRRQDVLPQDKLGWYYRYRRHELAAAADTSESQKRSREEESACRKMQGNTRKGLSPTEPATGRESQSEGENRRPAKYAKCAPDVVQAAAS